MRRAILLELKICISPQFGAIDPPNHTRGFILQNQNVRLVTTVCHPKFQNARFPTTACTKMYESNARRPRQPAPYKNHRFTTVSNVWPARSDERVARSKSKFAFRDSFGHPISTKLERVARAHSEFAFHHSFGRPTTTKRREGCVRDVINSHFTTVLGVRWARSDERVASATWKFAFHHSFGRPMSTKWREGCEGHVQNLHFTTVLGVRRPRSDERVASAI